MPAGTDAAEENRETPVEEGVANVVATGILERAANALNENELASIASVGFAVDDGSGPEALDFGSTVGVVAGEISSYFGNVLLVADFVSSGLLGTCCKAGAAAACLVASIG